MNSGDEITRLLAEPPSEQDVLIVGGGLAGLTLALQLRRRFADISVTVIERRRHPVPEAAHKVGESTVEIGAHYFSEVLGLKPHLDQAQLRKFGFRFFFSDGRRDIDQVTEIGASRHLSVPSWQIDRGMFENFLGAEARRCGVRFVDGAMVRQVLLADGGLAEAGAGTGKGTGSGTGQHRVVVECAGQIVTLQSRWLVDASGRVGLLKRQLGLARPNGHRGNAAWFRIKARIVIDGWSSDPAWQARCEPAARWRSTNHLVGPGYWVWLIPLASGSHSVGIVADPKLHPLESFDTFDKAMRWLQLHQPRLFDELDDKRALLQDFAFFRNYSYGCAQVFSADRWALTGEAGVFLDPFYSPGSDFIGIGNTYITELIATDRAGRPIGARARLYDQIYQSFYDNTLALYADQYSIFGDPEVLPVKVIWDYTYYWGVLAQFFFQDRLTDLAAFSDLRCELTLCSTLNRAVQDHLRSWSAVSARRNPAAMHDQAALPWFAELNRSLNDRLDEAQFRTRLRQSTDRLRRLAADMISQSAVEHPQLDTRALRRLLSTAPPTVVGDEVGMAPAPA